MNTREPLPGSLDFVQCVDGKDTIIQDYTKVDGWQNPEVMDISPQCQETIQRIRTFLCDAHLCRGIYVCL